MEKKSELTCADLILYVGCTCKTPAGHGIIDAVSRERIRVEVEFQGYVLPPDDVTPVLRPLSDMTEEEESEFVPLAAGSQIARFSSDNSGASNWRQWFIEFENGDTDHLIMNEQGETWFRSYFESAESRRNWSNTVNTHEQTIWLICHGFDVFKWIPTGLAIDKTKL